MISAVVPVFNGERFIARALESVRAQTRPVSEVIVIDDGSTDASGRIVREGFPEVRYERQSNGGAAAARNLGVERASNDWIAFLDADDFWYPEKLAESARPLALDAPRRLSLSKETSVVYTSPAS